MHGRVTGPVRVGIFLLVACLVLPAVPAAGATQAEAELAVQPRFRMDQTQLLIGGVQLDDPILADPGAVTVEDVGLPSGTLYVCPHEGGQRDDVPPFPVLEQRCRDEESFEDPELVFGHRTWLAFGGNYTLVDGAAASMTLFTQAGDLPGSVLMAQAISADGVRLGLDEGRLAFTPLLGSSEVTVETEDVRRQYNGTDWIFYFLGDDGDRVPLTAEGVFAGLQQPTHIRVGETDVSRLGPVLEADRLLDLQDAALGADAREPIGNATALFADRGRVPGLLNGALLGHINGTIGDRALDPGMVTVVRVDHLTGRVDRQTISGQASVLHWSKAGSISQGLDDPAQVPWVWIAILGVLASVAWLVGWDPAQPPRWERWTVRSVVVLGLVAWDLSFAGVTGTSAGERLLAGGDLGVILALLGFELIAAGLAALAIYLPLAAGLRRGLPPTWNRWGRIAGATGWLLVLVLLPATVIVLGQLVARL